MTDNETKIVKATKTNDANKDENASKVQIQAVDIAIIQAQKERAAKKKAAAVKNSEKKDRPAQGAKAPAGKPAGKSAAPIGKPLPRSSSSAAQAKGTPAGRSMPKNAVPQKKSDVPQPKTEEPVKTVQPEVEAPVIETKPAEENKPSVKIIKKAEEIVPENQSKAEKAPEDKPVVKTKEKAPVQKSADTKTENKTEEPKAPKKEVPVPQPAATDFDVPKFVVKIKRTAAEEKAAEEERKATAAARKAAQQKASAENKQKRDQENGPKRGGKDQKDAKDHRDQKDPQRKPKEFVGKKNQNGQEASSPRTKNAQGTVKGDKVVAYTAPSGGTQNGGKAKDRGKGAKTKDKERDKFGSKFNEIPADLSKKNKNKHSKYKESKVEEVEVISEEVAEAMATGGVVINVPITLAGFCEQVEKPTSAAIMALMKMGIMANINQNLDEETAILLGMELGVTVAVKKVEEVEEEEGIDRSEDRAADLLPRAPIITVMGHVDHGKTSILDAIRKTNVTAGEAGGITQAIGASEVIHNGQRIVFLDTPGHEAFTAMRARGAHITDIAVLVDAADDSVKPQTIESISHAKAAGVPIIVAINKMDKPAANPDLVKQDLANQGVLVEEWGGNTIAVPVSAKTGQGIDQLLEMILLQAEMLELKANPNRLGQGSVIEARLDKNLGPVATLLVMNGTLQAGAAVVAGTAAGRIRTMKSDKGLNMKKAGPATAVEITGLTEVPESGDEFFMVRDDKTAKEIAARRAEKLRSDLMAKTSAISLEKLFSQISEGEVKDLNIIIKADVQGSVEALQSSLEKLKNEDVRVNIIHTGVGTVTEGDVMLAGTSNALIIGFNVRPSTAVQTQADRDNVEIRCYRVIYEIIEDIEAAMKGMLNPIFKEVILGKVEVRTTFKVPNVGIIGGCYVTEGKVTRNAQLRLVRDGIVIHEGKVSSLKRFKDDAKEVLTGFECGLGIENYNDIKEGDIIEAFEMQEVERE